MFYTFLFNQRTKITHFSNSFFLAVCLEVISDNEFALLDGTFFNDGEVAGRDMSEIPHPFIVESIEYFEKIKNNVEISFIHFNHTNPLLNPDSDIRKKLNNQGYGATFLNQKFEL